MCLSSQGLGGRAWIGIYGGSVQLALWAAESRTLAPPPALGARRTLRQPRWSWVSFIHPTAQ